MTAIIDYGVGNLFSLKSSLSAVGEEAVVTSKEEDLNKADRLILPGVGAFRDARAALSSSGLVPCILENAAMGKPLLGICLGMQLLFEKDYEDGIYEGLGLIPGEVRSISQAIEPGLKIPHIGWNALSFRNRTQLFKYIKENDHVYFVHSYHATGCEPYTTSVTDYGGILTASVQRGNVYGTQFHPEKSATVGLSILKAFVEIF